ncbi:putative ubiquitin carboxyl-terminal hydrolase MINDY-4 isoform X2 [Nelusetta ayraudi]|uniref:putative ubiquitin carboxyl-terminal hydrolase MINDY-4 isoform X2 n=1 Tax=Nelusetta ayraudi TaxID=303726 RepID=UPI003F71088A
MSVSVEDVSSSLVREYLSRKGLKRTIACMDEEHPRTETSINNRSDLRAILHIEDLYRKNKAHNQPLKTLLEIIVKHHATDPMSDKINSNKRNSKDDQVKSNENDLFRSSPSPSPSIGWNASCAAVAPMVIDGNNTDDAATPFMGSKRISLSLDTDETNHSQPVPDKITRSNQNQSGTKMYSDNQAVPLLVENENFIRSDTEKRSSFSDVNQKSRNNRVRRGMMAGPVATTTQGSHKRRHGRKTEVPDPLLWKDDGQSVTGLSVAGLNQRSLERSLSQNSAADGVGGGHELWTVSERLQREPCFEKTGQDTLRNKKIKSLAVQKVAHYQPPEMVLDDICDDDLLQGLSHVSFGRAMAHHSYGGLPMDQRTTLDLKAVLLGSSSNCFTVEWRNQGFTFSEASDLRYGILQKKGGPCGVLASVQAFVLKNLLFERAHSRNAGLERLKPSSTTRRKCLIQAMAEILWRAGEEKQAVVTISSGRNHFTPTGGYRSEGVLEKVTRFTLDNFSELLLFLEQHAEQFESGESGCILLTISAVLSRSIKKVREDMDVSTSTLIGAHGYCTQELVNLLVCGRAVPNVFDNDVRLDSGEGNTTLLKGIKSQCDIGLLSLFEHYRFCEVGLYLKTPRYPIWLVCSESHFSVLFGFEEGVLTSYDREQAFDLYYYDGLANQQEEIRLTVSVGKMASGSQDVEADLIPPLELCIRTRWKDAHVDWNDTEPIL